MLAGFHIGLLAGMIHLKAPCVLCIIAATNSVALLVIVSHGQLRRLPSTVMGVVVGCGLASIAIGPIGPAIRHGKRDLRIVSVDKVGDSKLWIAIYEDLNCPICVDLRDRIMPLVVSKYGRRVTVSYHKAFELITPGLVGSFEVEVPIFIIRKGSFETRIKGAIGFENLCDKIDEALSTSYQ